MTYAWYYKHSSIMIVYPAQSCYASIGNLFSFHLIITMLIPSRVHNKKLESPIIQIPSGTTVSTSQGLPAGPSRILDPGRPHSLEPGPSLSSNPGPSHSSEPGPSYTSEPGPSHRGSSSLVSAINQIRRGHSTVSGPMSGSVQLPSLPPSVSLSDLSPNVYPDESPRYVPSPPSSISDIENEVRPDLIVIFQ